MAKGPAKGLNSIRNTWIVGGKVRWIDDQWIVDIKSDLNEDRLFCVTKLYNFLISISESDIFYVLILRRSKMK